MQTPLINVNGESVETLQIIFLMTLLTVLPSLVVMMTSFTRYVISFLSCAQLWGCSKTRPIWCWWGSRWF